MIMSFSLIPWGVVANCPGVSKTERFSTCEPPVLESGQSWENCPQLLGTQGFPGFSILGAETGKI